MTRPSAAGSGNARAVGEAPPAYLVSRDALPEVCATDPHRMVFTADAGGRCEVFTWDATTASARQVTDHPLGTFHGSIDARAHVWWFEEDAHGVGLWKFRPFDGGPVRDGLHGVPAGLARGLGVSRDGTVAVALGDPEGTTVYSGPRGGGAHVVARLPHHANLTGITAAGDLLAVGAQARSASAVTVFGTDGTRHAVLDEPEGALWSLGFGPLPARRDLLLVREWQGSYLLATWSPGQPLITHRWCAFDTEITGRWCPDGRAVLIRQDRHGRSVLHRADLDARRLTAVPTAPGTLLDASEQVNGDIHTLWTSTATPPRALSTAGTALPSPPHLPPRVPGVPRDLWTPGPDGPVHTLVTLPEGVSTPAPTVFLVHGGPADHDRDAYDGALHSLVASGFAVARVNYRGSTGYGPAWRSAMTEGVGLTQVADLASVRADLVARGWADPRALALWGTSWGAYLTLLALGARPGLWQAGVAVKPVAHLAHAHATTTPALRALDERLFGGTPREFPERYARSSPHTYVPGLDAPLLVVAATHDAKCPPGQIRDYLDELVTHRKRHEALWLDTGHDGYDGRDHLSVLRGALVFLDRELRGRPRATPEAPPSTRRGESVRPAGDPEPAANGTAQRLTER
ncbi:prolyl oligopeptidase family serine peptidase [Streptomyces sp. BE147]|uniref:prolyl oligopeptidase family serine peptidase n=1 Tax=unclassified Streptomyces TaxID=2593676 RepID=UPI002E793EC4|nr:prolyl oligopeptidase family serine peptidase [Streptomyces sp. BE147]